MGLARVCRKMGGQASARSLLALVSPHRTVLKSTFPFKKEEKIQELMEAGGWHPNSSNADLLNYHSLFIEVCVWVGDPEICQPLP